MDVNGENLISLDAPYHSTIIDNGVSGLILPSEIHDFLLEKLNAKLDDYQVLPGGSIFKKDLDKLEDVKLKIRTKYNNGELVDFIIPKEYLVDETTKMVFQGSSDSITLNISDKDTYENVYIYKNNEEVYAIMHKTNGFRRRDPQSSSILDNNQSLDLKSIIRNLAEGEELVKGEAILRYKVQSGDNFYLGSSFTDYNNVAITFQDGKLILEIRLVDK